MVFAGNNEEENLQFCIEKIKLSGQNLTLKLLGLKRKNAGPARALLLFPFARGRAVLVLFNDGISFPAPISRVNYQIRTT